MDALPSGCDELSRRNMLGLACGITAAVATAPNSALAALAAPTPASSIVMMDAVALAASIRTRAVSCIEVMSAFLDQIDRHNPSVNAIVARQDRAVLLKQASEQDDEAKRGEWRGPLHGFPHAPKDLQFVKGIVSTLGSPIYRDFVPATDSLMAERLRRAGAIFVGMSNSPEFGLGSHSYNRVYGTTLNPYDLSRSAGGSTGGGAVALALRMLPLADGSDFGGSLRNPAAWNNILGFRPSFGRVPAISGDIWTPGMAVGGPMARTIPDLALLLQVQSGFDSRAPLSTEGPGLALGGQLSADMKGKRIGWLGDFGGFTPCEAGVLDLCRASLKTFDAMGCIVEEARVDIPLEPVWDALLKLRAWLAGGGILDLYKDPAKRALMKPEAIFEVESGLRLSAQDIAAASAVRTQWYGAIRRLFQRFDYLVTPAAQIFPFDAKLDWPHAIGGVKMKTYHEWQKGNFLITMTGCPSLAVPSGFGAAGLPIGIQIVAPAQQDLACFQIGHAYMQAANWTAKRLPPQLH